VASQNRIAIIHVAKKQLGLDEEAYRAILSAAGLSSAKEIANDRQFAIVMESFAALGFQARTGKGGVKNKTTAPGTNRFYISKRQEYYIRGLWALASRAKDGKSLRAMIKRIGRVEDISFLPRKNAQAVILALRDICWKAGFNPDEKPKEVENVLVCQKGSAVFTAGKAPGVLPPVHGVP
jgi:hypothetical protein